MDEAPTACPRCWIRGRAAVVRNSVVMHWAAAAVRSRAAAAFDTRLAREVPDTRRFLVVGGALAMGTAGCVVAQAALLAHALCALTVPVGLGVVVVLRALLAWVAESAGQRDAARAASRLRARLLAQAVRAGPGRRAVETADLVTRVDALAPYFSLYLPRLVAAMVVPPVALAAMAVTDLLTAGVVVAAVVLLAFARLLARGRVPGAAARRPGTAGDAEGRPGEAGEAAGRRPAAPALAAHFSDVVAGLPTLTVFGRAREQGWNIARTSEQYRLAAIESSRSSSRATLALEAAATLPAILVAASAGLRLAAGTLTPQVALFVLFLAVEAGLPLQRAAVHLREGRGGLAAAGGILDFLETPGRPADPATARPAGGEVREPADVRSLPIRVEEVVVAHGLRSAWEAVPLTLTLAPGTTTALDGPPGAGKSALIAALLGFETPIAGRIMVGDRHLVTGGDWRSRIAWVPQRPALFAGTVADNIAVAVPGACAGAVAAAAAAAGVGSPDRLEARLGPGGAGLPVAGSRRVALARALLRCELLDIPLLLLDDPTADLDVLTEIELAEVIGSLLPGRTALIVTRRRTLLDRADQVVSVGRPSAAPMSVPA